tara:strand:- start:470 stop:1129 length:660 start_codon:yes stop_codon:yes gene_type:complete
MENYQSLLAQNTTSGSGTALVKMPDGSVRRYPVGSIPDGATPMSIDGQKVNVAPSTKFDPRSGTMIGEDAPEGFRRYWAGFTDMFTGGDADKRGHGGGKESDQGYGGIADDHVKKDGKIVPKTPEDTRSDIEKITGKDWDKYMQSQKDLLLDVGKEKFRQQQMARLPDLAHAAFGGSYASALQPGMANLAQIASASRAYQFNTPTIRNSSINFASLLGR